ncbi:MAG: maleylpyruvate isomerase N-terminal domain-containing protein [Actinomycetota bacterium]
MSTPLAALTVEVQRTAVLLESLSLEQWQKPTRCEPLSVFEIAVHACRGAARTIEMIEKGPVDSEPEKDGVTYFQYDSSFAASGVVTRAQQDAMKTNPLEFAIEWSKRWGEAFDACRAQKGDPVLHSIFGLMRLSEYLRTRVVEVTIHTMDMRQALGMEPDPSHEGLETCADVLRGLLGIDVRRIGIDDVRFCLIGTGREPLNENERELLGPLSESFPLFS